MSNLQQTIWRIFAVLALLTACSPTNTSQQPDRNDALAQGFLDPPNSARPRVWWHWMNGNISKDGILKDIEWMARVGIGGLQNFDAALETPQIVDKRLVYMTPEWKDAFHYAAEQAEQHGLELAIAGSPGWSETGGPWVKPQDGMKKLVWSEIDLPGGQRFNGKLPAIPGATGMFQDLKIESSGTALTRSEFVLPQYAADVAVLAYPLTAAASDVSLPRIETSDGKPLDAKLLADGGYVDAVDVAKGTAERPAAITLRYDRPQTIRALTIYLPGVASMFMGASLSPVLEATDDGKTWRRIVDVPVGEVPTTVSFAPVTAARFQVVLKPRASAHPLASMGKTAPGVDMMSMMSAFGANAGSALAAAQAKPHALSELALHPEARINAFEVKAGFAIAGDYYALDDAIGSDTDGVAPGSVVDLTARMAPDGRLDWTPPAGRWRVIRLGYSLTGKTNHPAPAEATGLEVDKYDGRAVRDYLETYLGMYRSATGDALIGAHGLRAFLTDSIEVGPSNWTPGMVAQFKRLRGYDPTPWLPALAGVIIGSRAQSDAFLYDYRRTLADLIASEHYGQVAKFARENGLRYYSEALESHRVTLGDDMAMRTHTDIPMAAIWHAGGANPQPVYTIDIRGAASVAHIHGQNLVAAESLTSALQPWASTPAELRPTIDLAFAHGVNRPVIHTSVHQPADARQPGLALLIFGQYFNRHESWAEMAKPWVDYLARSSYLLQQGRNHADVAYFYGEEAPLVELYKDGVPKDAPRNYAFDFIDADAVLGALRVEGSELATPGGARYRLLYLGGSSKRMTLPMLRRLNALVEEGATIAGQPPERSPSLKDDPAEFAALVKRLWNTGNARVISSTDVEGVLASLGVAPDFSYRGGAPDGEILFQHRRLDDGEIYFLSNRATAAQTTEARFRVTGMTPEIWRADSAELRPVSYRIEQGATVIPLEMAPQDSFFVVFRKPARSNSATVPSPRWTQAVDIGSGAWDVSLQSGRGAPAGVKLAELAPLNESTDPGVKYFSGVATYRKSFQLPAGVAPGQALLLDLGNIGDVAEVRVNGTLAGTVWREPHRIEIGKLIKPGTNELDIRVANLWVNRLIGDAQPGATKITWTSTPVYLANAPLRPSGLIGPVQLFTAAR